MDLALENVLTVSVGWHAPIVQAIKPRLGYRMREN